MTAKELKTLTVRELREKAKAKGLAGYSKKTKAELVKLLAKPAKKTELKKGKKGKKGKTPSTKALKSATPKKVPAAKKEPAVEKKATKLVDSTPPSVPAAPAPEPFDLHHDLPTTYGRAHATLMLKNPEWMFLHWDLDGYTGGQLRGGPGFPTLRVLRNGVEVHRAGIDLEAKRYYVRVPVGGGRLRVELGREHYGEFHAVLSSEEVEAPVARVSSNPEVALAAPSWTGVDPTTAQGAQVLSEKDFSSFFGEVRNDLPWYRTAK